MAQHSPGLHEFISPDLRTDSECQILQFPNRFPANIPSDRPGQSAVNAATGPRARVSERDIQQVKVLGVSGRLSDVVESLNRAIQLAVADEPRAVVCDLSDVLSGAEPAAVEALATAGRHVRDWSGVPIGVATADPLVRMALRAHPLGRRLIASESLFCAVSEVLATPAPTIERLRLTPHPTAPRAARDFVTRTLLDWQLNRVVPFASLVVSKLVASSFVNDGSDFEVSVAWSLGALRLTVRAHHPGLLGQWDSGSDLDGRDLAAVSRLSRACGTAPTANGGKVVWAVLGAPRRQIGEGSPR